ncbi:RloB domain-containing protein [Chitinophaga agrisoli]|uniref:RloB domain-containing protein n=1 Tax=Chitinophaga agrisoli TaxID=2607653 RepID=A0A5B2VJA3_9BACT|nr:RloB family protein [Chitinophaga agrisoli]KAA2238616.1 RloB domain-containing protein [Chitinophaga agrisoli]
MARVTLTQQHRNTVAIVGDGQTERIYFSDVRDTDRPANLSIFPDYPRKIGHYKGVLDRALALQETYDRVYALVDLDKVIQDGQQACYARDKAAAEAAGVIVLENNPCFETWLLLHFMHTGRSFTSCKEVCTQLRAKCRIPNYEKSERFLRNARLYGAYKELLATQAIPNARKLEKSRAVQGPLYPRAETFRFFQWYLEMGK